MAVSVDVLTSNSAFLIDVYGPRPICNGTVSHPHRAIRDKARLILPLEWRDGLTLTFIQCRSNYTAIPQSHLPMGFFLKAERMLHPLFVVPLRIILASMRAARFCSGCCRDCSLGSVFFCVSKIAPLIGFRSPLYLRAGQKIPEFKSLYQVGVPYHAPITDANVIEFVVNIHHFLDTFVECLLGAEDVQFHLHCLLHSKANLMRALCAV